MLKGQKDSFRFLVEKYQRMVYNTCWRILKNQNDAEDVSQEVFLEVFRSVRHLKDEHDLAGWIFKIAYNKSLNLYRKNSRKLISGNSKEKEISDSEPLMVSSEMPDTCMESKEAMEILFRAIDCLPEAQKNVLLLHKFEGSSHKEICSLMNLSLASVESLIYRSKRNLRKSLANYFKQQINKK